MIRNIPILLLLTCSYATIPSTFKRCSLKQKDFNTCFSDAVQNAVTQLNKPFKEIGLPSLDPLEISSLSMGVGDGPVGFDQKLENIKVYGFSKCDCKNTMVTSDLKEMRAVCFCPEVRLEFQYEFNGKLLVLPFSGKGSGWSNMNNTNCTLSIKLSEYQKKGRRHFRASDNSFVMLPENVVTHFDNLFGDDEAINDNVNKVFNENWKALYDDVGKNYNGVIGDILENFINRVFSRVTIEEMLGE